MNDYGTIDKLWWRLHNLTRRITLHVGDDTGVYQTYQTEGYPGELRDDIPRVQEFGISTMPLPGAEGLTVSTNAGYHGTSAITNTNDPRYRVKNQKPGETALYIVDEADKKTGDNGKCRTILKGALQWITSVIGKTINIGDSNVTTINAGTTPSDNLTINVGESNKVTINVKGKDITIAASGALNITGATGDVVVNGISLVHHVHGDPGEGTTDPPQ